MPYVAYNDLLPMIPAHLLLQAVDDDKDGTADPGVWDAIAESASDEVDGYLGQSYKVPFASPVPALVSQSALIFAGEMVYHRRGAFGDSNPFASRAVRIRERLERIGRGDEPLTPGTKHQTEAVAVITEPSRLYNKDGMMF